MKDIDSQLRDYAREWRARQPAPPDHLDAVSRPLHRRAAFLVGAAAVIVLMVGSIAAIVHRPVTHHWVDTRPGASVEEPGSGGSAPSGFADTGTPTSMTAPPPSAPASSTTVTGRPTPTVPDSNGGDMTTPPSTTAPGVPPWYSCEAQKIAEAPMYVGLTVEQARSLASSRGDIVRILEEDGVSFPATADGNPHRVDVFVAAGKVTYACHE